MSSRSDEAKRVSFSALVLIETRKAVDTRGSRTLLAITTALALVLLCVGIFFGGSETLGQAVGGVAASYALFLPLIGLMLVTQEWTQRTAYLTFAAVPQRHRILLAKAVAALGLNAVIMSLAVLAAVGLAAAKGLVTGESLAAADLGSAVRSVLAAGLCSTVLGVAVGAIALSTTLAILTFMFVPLAIDLGLGFAPPALGASLSASTMSGWLGGDQSWSAPVLVSALVWYLLPCVAGTWRFLRCDVS